MIYFTADTHFWHKNVLKYCDRPFHDIEHMNNTIINNWNEIVSKDDNVYIVGDFAFSGITKQKDILSQLNGTKRLVRGNHDYERNDKYISMGFTSVDDFVVVEDLFICHYPLFNEQQLENNMQSRKHVVSCELIKKFFEHYKESFTQFQTISGVKHIVHGHIHNIHFIESTIKHINVGVDVREFKPMSINDVKKLL